LPTEYRVVRTPSFAAKVKATEYRSAYQRAEAYVYPQLRANPFFGANIKKLKGEFAGVYRYRIGDFRLFSTIRKKGVVEQDSPFLREAAGRDLLNAGVLASQAATEAKRGVPVYRTWILRGTRAHRPSPHPEDARSHRRDRAQLNGSASG